MRAIRFPLFLACLALVSCGGKSSGDSGGENFRTTFRYFHVTGNTAESNKNMPIMGDSDVTLIQNQTGTTQTAGLGFISGKIDELKKQLATQNDAPKSDLKVRAMRKELRRAQRRFAGLTPLSLENQLKRSQKILDLIGKTLGEITKGAKKVVGNPYVHSLRKKTKSYNKRIKKANRLLEKIKKGQAPAPAEVKPAEGAPPT